MLKIQKVSGWLRKKANPFTSVAEGQATGFAMVSVADWNQRQELLYLSPFPQKVKRKHSRGMTIIA
jgi:hypothetical protein